jgi:hypothetical protein
MTFIASDKYLTIYKTYLLEAQNRISLRVETIPNDTLVLVDDGSIEILIIFCSSN